jgi:hemerythrin-like domain-containing protein
MTRRRRHPILIPLSHEHREALGLAFRLHHPAPPGPVTAMTPASTADSRAREVLAFVDDRLARHFRAEEEALFPFLRARLAGDPGRLALLDQLTAEHRQLEARRDGVATADGDGALAVALTAFADLLEAHVRLEERELFEHFPESIPPAEAEGVRARIRTLLDIPPAAPRPARPATT